MYSTYEPFVNREICVGRIQLAIITTLRGVTTTTTTRGYLGVVMWRTIDGEYCTGRIRQWDRHNMYLKRFQLSRLSVGLQEGSSQHGAVFALEK